MQGTDTSLEQNDSQTNEWGKQSHPSFSTFLVKWNLVLTKWLKVINLQAYTMWHYNQYDWCASHSKWKLNLKLNKDNTTTCYGSGSIAVLSWTTWLLTIHPYLKPVKELIWNHTNYSFPFKGDPKTSMCIQMTNLKWTGLGGERFSHICKFGPHLPEIAISMSLLILTLRLASTSPYESNAS